MEKLRVRRVAFPDGERYPLLLRNGEPLLYPTLFVTTQFRNRSLSAGTAEAALAAIKRLLVWCQEEEWDLEARLRRRKWLTLQEIEGLVRETKRRKKEALTNRKEKVVSLRDPSQAFLTSGEEGREGQVTLETSYARLSYIAQYLEWLAVRLVEEEVRSVSREDAWQIGKMVHRIRAYRPKRPTRGLSPRRGLTSEAVEAVFEVVEPEALLNPFQRKVRRRNELIAHLLYFLGLRNGELLALKVDDIDTKAGEVLVARRPDDPEDPRRDQPRAKTLDRRIPITEALARQVQRYVTQDRRHIPGARSHRFLLVTHAKGAYQGRPVTGRAIQKMLAKIREASPKRIPHLHPHIFRHTWNDRFSDLMDQKEVSRAEEEKIRSYIMGWREGSGMAQKYQRRHVERQAKKAALSLQQNIISGLDNE